MLWRIKFPEVGLTRRQVAGNLGVGPATLNTRIRTHHYTDRMSNAEREFACQNQRLQRANRILKGLRRIGKPTGGVFFRRIGHLKRRWIKKAIPEDLFPDDGHAVFRKPNAVSSRFVEKAPWGFPVERLCQMMNVSPRGLWAFRSRSASPLSVSVSALVAVPSAPRCQVPPAEPRPEASPRCCGTRAHQRVEDMPICRAKRPSGG